MASANGWCSRTLPPRWPASPKKGLTPSTRAPSPTPSSRRAAPRAAFSPRPDFEQYAVRELKPVTCNYRGYEIISSPPPSSGGVIICEILNVLEGYPLSYLGCRLGRDGACHGRGDALRLCRPQLGAWRSRFRRQSGLEAARQGLCQGDPRQDRSVPGRRLAGPDAEGLWREQGDDALFDHRQGRQCGRGHLYAERLVRRRRRRRRHRHPAQQRDGRFHLEAGRAQSLRAGAGRGQRHRSRRRRRCPR